MVKSFFELLSWLLFGPIRLLIDIFSSDKYREKVLYFSAHRDLIPTDNISPKLREIGYPKQSLTLTKFGGGFYGRRGNLLIDSGGSGGELSEKSGDFSTDIGSGGGRFNLGYMLLGGWLRVYPIAGMIGSGQGVSIQKAGDNEADVAVGSGGLTYQVGIGVELRIGWKYGIILGVRGIIINPDETRRFSLRGMVGVGKFKQ